MTFHRRRRFVISRLQWRAMQVARREGCTSYDL